MKFFADNIRPVLRRRLRTDLPEKPVMFSQKTARKLIAVSVGRATPWMKLRGWRR